MKLIFTLFSIFLFFGCGQKSLYHESQSIAQAIWSYEDHYKFELEISDTSKVYEMQLVIKHSKSYNYQNLYLMVETEFPTLDTKSERLNIDLADKKGQWKGNCSSETCKVNVYMLDAFKFPEPGMYSFNFVQDTRQPELDGILQLDLMIDYKYEE